METAVHENARTRLSQLAPALLSAVLAALAFAISVFSSFAACFTPGVQGGSPREAMCSVPQIGFWIYPIAVGVIATLTVVGLLLAGRVRGRQAWTLAFVPAAALLLVPVVMVLIPG